MTTPEEKFAKAQEDNINQEIIKAIQCKNCERDLNDVQLYECSFNQCTKKNIYCKSCGNLAHSKTKTHKWRESKKRINKNNVDLRLVKKGYLNLELMIKNKSWSGWKETASQVVSYASGTAIHAAQVYHSLLYAGNVAKVNTQLIDLVVDVKEGISHGSKALKSSLMKATPWAIVAAASIDIIVHSHRFWRGDIENWKEFGWYCSRSILTSSASGLSGWGGSCVGCAIGTAICPGVGTIAGGIIAGLLGSILGGTFTSKVFDQVWKNPNQKQREQIVREAISWFHFRHDEIFDKNTGKFNENKFNKELIMKRYRKFAKIYHPDRDGGDLEKWNELQMSLGLLLALCDKDSTQKNKAVKCIKAIGI